MNNRRWTWIAGLGCAALVLVVLIGVGGLLLSATSIDDAFTTEGQGTAVVAEVTTLQGNTNPTATHTLVQATEEMPGEGTSSAASTPMPKGATLASLYPDLAPGVVQIRVYIQRGYTTDSGAGSGFILDQEGHIVTNHHVVADADLVTVIFHEETEVRAQIVGTDAHSDLAVVKVDRLPEGAHPLLLGSSSAVSPGDWVIAIGNPFSLGSSITLGIVSAVGRTIPAAETPFSIPSAVQTDAAINPGNSGGPLLTLDGHVVGVNAQIESTTGTNTGVGFAIPSDVVSLVAPALIEEGEYHWPWLGVTGTDVGLLVQEANDLEIQEGAYVVEVVENGPAAVAGLRAATRERDIMGQAIPVGGDVVIEVDEEPIANFTDLLTAVAFRQPGDSLELTILRSDEQRQVTVELDERPASLGG